MHIKLFEINLSYFPYRESIVKELRKKPPNGVNSKEITYHNGIIKVKDIEHARNMFLK